MNGSFSRSTFPPGGWFFHQPQTGWSSPTPTSSTFDQTVLLIIKERQRHPAISAKYRLSTDIPTVQRELERFTKLRLGIQDAQPVVSLSAPPPRPSQLLISAAEDIKRLARGAALLIEWNNSNLGPVAGEIALSRASRCELCPLNSKSRLGDWLNVPVAAALKTRLGRIMEMNLMSQDGAKLGLCLAIFAPACLLIHAPQPIFDAKMKPEMRQAIDPKCWLQK